MNAKEMKQRMLKLGIAEFDYFERIGSTNDAAKDWLDQGGRGNYAAYAEEQSTGRGRSGRDWQSPKGASISLSIGLGGNAVEEHMGPLLPGLAGIACAKTLQDQEGLEIELKWPNDLLLGGKKVGGILIESEWKGQDNQSNVIGIGINVAANSVMDDADFAFPASYLEAETSGKVDKEALALGITREMLTLIQGVPKAELLARWNSLLAFQGEEMRIQISSGDQLEGKIMKVDEEGRIVILDQTGHERRFAAGEIRLPPRNLDRGS